MFNNENKITWYQLAPSVRKLFTDGLDKSVPYYRGKLDDEIAREKAALAKILEDIKKAIEKFKSDQFGAGGVKGRVLKFDISALYADDHFFNVDDVQGNKIEWFYRYNLDTGKYYNNNGGQQDIPYRSFLYDESEERLWYYWSPGRYEEIKPRYIKKTNTNVTNPINLKDSGFDTYENHVRYFKVFDNGWCEQVGAYSHYHQDIDPADVINYYNRYVKLRIPFKDTNYIITLGGEVWPTTSSLCTHGYGIYIKYTDKFRPSICGNNVGSHWRYSTYHACGFVDLATYTNYIT